MKNKGDGPAQHGHLRQTGVEDAQAGHGYARHCVGDGHDQDQNRAKMGPCACRPRLGKQEAPRIGGFRNQSVVRLDTGHGQGHGHAVPRRDR